ncbi:MAG: type II secretion system F family protein [Gammaproteobacteria bacterium]|nr:MAG: type II secretion system F family protein [Gammaproteobacteria bacterium]
MAEAAVKDEAIFVYEGKDKAGKLVRGELVGATEAIVKAQLRRQGITASKLKKKKKKVAGAKITASDIAVFARQLTTMMTAGVPLVQAFEIVGRGHENPKMQDLILAIKADVEGGLNLADAMEKHPIYFDDLFVQLVRAGEQSGALETLLDKVATYKEKNEQLKGKIKKAMFYPIAVIVVAMIVSAILLIFVVPQFKEVFASFGAELPAFTQMVINLSEWLQAYWFFAAAGIGGIIYAFVEANRRSRAFHRFLDRVILKLPVVGSILVQATIARFANTMSTMFAAGVPLVEAMDSVAGASGNVIYEEAIMKMKDDIASGTQLQTSMRTHGLDLFPNMVIQMVAIGEESGQLDTMLTKVAEFYEELVDNAIDGLTSLLEPLIMAFLGIVVGGLVVAMYLPIFKLGAVV